MQQTHQVKFTGDAKTYFGIWIVNILLSIVTLGIYSAWAKVRTKRYFAQNTLIDGRRFDYHATGKQILIGRIIVILGLIVLMIPILNLIGAVALFFLFPWLMNRALMFNARKTSFSGLRFGFDGSYGRAFLVYIIYPVLSALTLFIFMPFAIRARHRYTINGHRYGTARFSFDSAIWPFYKAALLAIGWVMVATLIGFVLLGGPRLLNEFIIMAQMGDEPDPALMIRFFLMYGVLLVAIMPAAFIYQAYIRNMVYAHTALQGGHRLVSNVSAARLMWIAMSNVVVIVLTLGLMLPWARIRFSRYLADCTQFIADGSLDEFIGVEEGRVTALGDAYADLEGLDVGLAI